MNQAIRDLKQQGTAIILTTHYLEEADSLADEIVVLKQGEIIHRGTSEQIKAKVSTTTIRFVSPNDCEQLATYAGVTELANSGKYTALQTSNPNQTLVQLLAAHPDLEDLTVSRAGLEKAFLELNKNQ
jgi:ABC-2 type transport system ATP-binding protein